MKTWMLTCVVAHGCSMGTPYGTPTARPASISVASTCEFGLESARLLLCKYVWFHSPVHSNAFCHSCLCILVHSDAYDASIFPWKCGSTVRCIQVYYHAFLRILVHTDAYDASMIAPRGAHPNRVLFLHSALEYKIMHMNAS